MKSSSGESAAQAAARLRAEIEQHNVRYYVYDEPSISDAEYDGLMRELQALEADHEYLEAGDVFSSDLIDTWVRIKREDLAELQQRPHPYEFDLYYDI